MEFQIRQNNVKSILKHFFFLLLTLYLMETNSLSSCLTIIKVSSFCVPPVMLVL